MTNIVRTSIPRARRPHVKHRDNGVTGGEHLPRNNDVSLFPDSNLHHAHRERRSMTFSRRHQLPKHVPEKTHNYKLIRNG